MDTPSHESKPVPLVECPMCHCRVPEKEMTQFAGRRLCLACASAWFEDDERDD